MPHREAGKDNVVVTNAAERVKAGIHDVLSGALTLIQHLLRSGKLDGKGAYPPYSVVSGLKAAALHV